MEIGNRIVVTKTREVDFRAGDLATLTMQDGDGDWWADFDVRVHVDGDREMCLQKGYTEFEQLAPETQAQ